MTRRKLPESAARMRAVAYIRVSTAKQSDRGHSLEAQRAKLESYAALYDLEIVAFEVDAGESAKSLERPALQRALAALRSGAAEALLIVKLDRLTRHTGNLSELLDQYFGSKARRPRVLLSAEDQVDTRSASGRMVLNVLTSVGQWEREAIGERTAAVKKHLRVQGRFGGGDAPFGYRVVDGLLVEDAGEQAVIAAVRSLHAAGLSMRAIAATLAERGTVVRGGARPKLGHVFRMLSGEPVVRVPR